MKTLNRRKSDPKCQALLFRKEANGYFQCTRPKGHKGPHVHREVGEKRVFTQPTVDVNFTVMWITK